jgi:hypothetical protein
LDNECLIILSLIGWCYPDNRENPCTSDLNFITNANNGQRAVGFTHEPDMNVVSEKQSIQGEALDLKAEKISEEWKTTVPGRERYLDMRMGGGKPDLQR